MKIREKAFFGFMVVLVLFLFFYARGSGAVVLNEILANEPGGWVSLEWTELFNDSDEDVNLAGWRLVSGPDTNTLSSVVILAGGYLVLARKLISPSDSISFEGHWGDNSKAWGDSPEEDFPVVEIKVSLTNGCDSVELIDTSGNKQRFVWIRDSGDGVSWEKINPSQGDLSDNWDTNILSCGSTPGKVNSIGLVENDLGIEALSFSPENPKENQPLILAASVKNVGLDSSGNNSLTFYSDYDLDQDLEEAEKLGSPISIPSLEKGESCDVSKSLLLGSGNYRVYAKLDQDDKPYNNLTQIDLRVGGLLPEIILNEFLPNPQTSGSEWVELHNRSAKSVSLKGWCLGDQTRQEILTDEDIEVAAGGYLLVTEDYDKFLLAYPQVDCLVLEQKNWQTLNNDGDRIILRDAAGFKVEELSYQTSWETEVSWERINPEVTADEPDNWWKCVDSSGSTPGKINSLSVLYSSEIRLQLEPRVFSPDGDGFEDELKIKYALPLRSNLTLKIYDIKGRAIKTLMEERPQVSGEMIWDGRDDKNRTVRIGIYVLYARVSGNVNGETKTSFVVAKR